MKKVLILLTLLSCAWVQATRAQIHPDPAHWAYAVKKLKENTYEIHLRCKIDTGWHIYAQKQGENFIGTRTKLDFGKQPGLSLVGVPAELGKKEIYKNTGIINYEYAGTVDFVQKIKLNPNIKSIKVSVTYQTCTHTQCLAEKTIDLEIPIKD